ncbi:acetate/propionate family kinase [Phaeovulum sp. NW3]|uniref:acetate/propionate family kinase n=1 Tax=Phaeovulum sp. NW3 TaxID=2934933 RepID=UPI0024C283D7|nr:acetate/propionate family kinase [Phaeovulum sp. NW3]
MRILVFNAGSSTLKFALFDMACNEAELVRGTFERFSPEGCSLSLRSAEGRSERALPLSDIAAAIGAVPGLLTDLGLDGIDAVGHRVAHGGPQYAGPVAIDDTVLQALDALVPLAPLHNPANLQAVRLARATWPDLPQVAVFDTSFHLTNPAFVTTYAVPEAWRGAGLRRFGFHGTSHKYVALRAAQVIGQPIERLQIISCHLGNGASVCAINRGRSMDSSMGLTPLEGLVMGTRSGDIDPGAFGYLHRELGLSIPEIEAALYKDSGLKALTGSSDMRDVEHRAAEGDHAAQLAIEIYAYRARKYIGAYAAAMGGLDALVFTGGIGENSASMRRRICDGLEFMGVTLDHDRNQHVDLADRAAPELQAWGGRVRVIVTETAEQLQIARETAAALAAPARPALALPVAVSARHVHLCQADVEALFGPGATLTPEFDLRQPGNFAAVEKVRVEGPRGGFDHVRILGPTRGRTQVEVSRTDTFALGVQAPVRLSGDLAGTPKVRLIGPAGTVETDGLIIAARHIHMNPADARRWGVADGQEVEVRVTGTGRGVSFARTIVRTQPDAFTEMHIDTDEANAAGIVAAAEGTLIPAAE